MTNDETFHQRPILKRLDTGWLAWQATIGYISHAHSADAVLTLTAYPVSEVAVGWSASLLWGEHVEAVHNESSLAAALRGLWAKIEAHHTIFLDSEAAVRRPVDYADDA
ncbi:MAG: hypothetical protein K8J31_28085, partial [Anaerolineae bacterium]|nr:hypothetical protein [Anaerolineae bacterium]